MTYDSIRETLSPAGWPRASFTDAAQAAVSRTTGLSESSRRVASAPAAASSSSVRRLTTWPTSWAWGSLTNSSMAEAR